MYNIKKKNKIIYKIYNKLRKDKKFFFTISISYGIDSNLVKKIIKIINKNILEININHNYERIEKKIYNKKNKKNIFKIKIKKNKNIEKLFKFYRFKKIKNICIKKIVNIWICQEFDEIFESFLIQVLKNKLFLQTKREKINRNVIKKIKPINMLKKKYIKLYSIKNKKKWIEEKNNIKFKNLRNKLRINIINNLNINLKNLKEMWLRGLKCSPAKGKFLKESRVRIPSSLKKQ
ncbi:tRNA(Ile)-lysidine synthetase [Candidatus Nasuia deltocephalinicola str. NAS-ALF]|uniref:tRNA(Ile)-lysidine synthetase n=1 Tax=Candidatus Nasuia deltocephalinicola str. NAS-ALF TaxID=1343077 RepID=S5TF02_9PROT|nr:tRNA(Ile)-lysidine synthetase [Candidatus Nasuia deltocephalinicola str. NAS-ALF]